MEYNLSGKISLDDFIQFNKFHSKHSLGMKFSIIIYFALFVFLGFQIFSKLKSSSFEIFKILLPLIIVLLFILLLKLFIMPIIIMPRTYKRHYNTNKLSQYIQTININDQFISITTEISTVKLTKSDINEIKYDKDAIYIYSALNIGYIIKKRFLENENDFEAMVDFIKLNYDKK